MSKHITLRVPDKMLEEIDAFCEKHMMTNRSAAILYLISKGIIFERCSDIDTGKAVLVERDLIDD